MTTGTDDLLARCILCGHECRADRLAGQTGRCGMGKDIRLAAHLLHFGEEPPISGDRGSGTLFFSGCPLNCIFCQNYQISQENRGQDRTTRELAEIMLALQNQGALNINLVSPTPFAPLIRQALGEARPKGLSLPVVYNTGGFDSLETLALMEGLVDVYLPDMKYCSPVLAGSLSGAANYPQINQAALKEMFRQVGPLTFDPDGTARRGLLIRHLVLPGHLDDTEQVLEWLAETFGPDTWVSLMAQYHPMHRAAANPQNFPELARGLSQTEYDQAMDAALALGMENVFIQELSSAETYLPDFDRPQIFK